MIVKLIHSKLRLENASQMALCGAIRNTAHYLADRANCDNQLWSSYIKALVSAAAHSMFTWEIATKLQLEGSRCSYPGEMEANALVAAIGTNQPQLVDSLLKRGANATVKTRFFGEPLVLAASLGFKDILGLLLNSLDSNTLADYFTRLRYIHAVEAAAEAGHEEILTILLRLETPFYKSPPPFDRAIIKAVRSAQESSARFLLHQRPPNPQPSKERGFWVNLVRTSAECDCQLVLQEFIAKAMPIVGAECLRLALEDATRHGHTESVRFLLSKLSDRDPQIYTGSLFWAARLGNTAIIDALLEFLGGSTQAIVKALAGATSGNQPEMICYLLKLAGVEMMEDVIPKRFSDTLHHFFPNLPHQISYRSKTLTSLSDYPLSLDSKSDTFKKVELLRGASTYGNLAEAVGIFSNFAAQHPDDDMGIFSSSFSAAAENNYPDILLYLCENRYPYFVSSCAKSTAIFQIFFDFGWDINETEFEKYYPRFGYVASMNMCGFLLTLARDHIGDEHLSRWLLDRGANSSARGDMDITPTSAATVIGSISTINLLLERGAGIGNGQLLHYAMQRHDEDALELVELLLDLGCPINSIMFQDDPQSWAMYRAGGAGTPLCKAAERGRADIVAYLLRRGADPTIRHSNGQTVIQVAKNNGYSEVAKILENAEIKELRRE